MENYILDDLGRISVTYDQDFEALKIGSLEGSSIIQVRIHPITDKFVLPIMERIVTDISSIPEIGSRIKITEHGLSLDDLK